MNFVRGRAGLVEGLTIATSLAVPRVSKSDHLLRHKRIEARAKEDGKPKVLSDLNISERRLTFARSTLIKTRAERVSRYEVADLCDDQYTNDAPITLLAWR